jgi:hypothetical protein
MSGSARRPSLSPSHCGEHAFTELQAFPFPHASVEGKSQLAQLNGVLAQFITELLHGTLLTHGSSPIGAAGLRESLPAGRRPSQFFLGAALYQQGNEIAQGTLVEPRIRALNHRRDVIVREFCVFLGKTTLYRINLCPLFSRHARHHRHRTGVWSTRGWKIDVIFTTSKALQAIRQCAAAASQWHSTSSYSLANERSGRLATVSRCILWVRAASSAEFYDPLVLPS